MANLRFAPSPTSQPKLNAKGELEGVGLHIGSVRTALFNYLYHLKMGGKFILRLEDTDTKRSNDLCTQAILRDFDWLGIKFTHGLNKPDADGYPSKQSLRKELYAKYVKRLKDKELVGEKPAKDEEDKDIPGKVCTYYKMPKENIVFYDGIKGLRGIKQPDCQDFVLIKGDDMPSFYLAVTADDDSMGITDVIRGTEHIPTTFKQLSILHALGAEEPNFYHLSLLLNPDGTKMSKRQAVGQVSLWDFAKDGYHKDVLLRYVMSLGWSKYKDVVKQYGEFFSINQAAALFDPSNLSKVDSRFDYKRLKYNNRRFLLNLTPKQLEVELVNYAKIFEPEKLEFLQKHNLLGKIVQAWNKNISLLSDPFRAEWIYKKPVFEAGDIDLLEQHSRDYVGVVKDFMAMKVSVEDRFKNLKRIDLTVNNIVQIVRFALTKTFIAPTIQSVIEILGEKETNERLKDFTKLAKKELVYAAF